MRLWLAVILLAALSLAAPRLFEPSTITLLQAMRDLGPISGWRCAQSATYLYEPRHERADSTLLAEAPDDALKAQVPEGLEVDRVEANLHGGDTVIWAQVVTRTTIQTDAEERPTESQIEGERRVYVLSPGHQQAIGSELAADRLPICFSGLRDWHIVAEHGLQ